MLPTFSSRNIFLCLRFFSILILWWNLELGSIILVAIHQLISNRGRKIFNDNAGSTMTTHKNQKRTNIKLINKQLNPEKLNMYTWLKYWMEFNWI